jgi:hypothetical protein
MFSIQCFIRKFICAENLKANYEVMDFFKLKNIESSFLKLKSPSKSYVYINLSLKFIQVNFFCHLKIIFKIGTIL